MLTKVTLLGMLGLAALSGEVLAQQPTTPRDYYTGNVGLGIPPAPPAPGDASSSAFAATSRNVRMYGALYSVESCVYDPGRGVIVAASRSVTQAVRANDAWIAF